MSRIRDSTGKWVGIIEWHRNPQGEYCGGYIPFRGTSDRKHEWDVMQEIPLTLSPSLKCNTCGNHGWIINGRWSTSG